MSAKTGPEIVAADELAYAAIVGTLVQFPEHLLALMAQQRIKYVVLERGQRYDEASEQLRELGLHFGQWAAPPAGLFVIGEGTVYLRSVNAFTIAHETGHAIDFALGGGAYLSGSPAFRWAYRKATGFVTPYAAGSTEEAFAEGVRAFVEINDPRSPWPPATRRRLRSESPAIHAFITEIFDQGPLFTNARGVRGSVTTAA